MTVITGNIRDIGLEPLSGTLIATSVEFRSEGSILIAPESRSWPVTLGDVVVDLLPGPARITVAVGSHVRESWDVIVPDTDVELATLIEDSIEWAPPIVSIVGEHRRAAEEAAGRAEQAADDVDAAIAGAADQVVQAVEGDRVAAEQAASDAAGSASSASGSASAAAGSASDAASSATAAGSSATAAAGSAGDAAGSATAAAGSASDAASSASAAADSATDADTARAAAVVARTGAETARAGAEDARDAADGHADRAELAANSFDLTATATTGAAGSNAAVTVTGDGPAYGLSFTVPRGAKGDKGDKGLPGAQEVAWTDGGRPYLLDEVEAGAGGSGALTGAGRPDIPSTTGGVIQGNEPVGALFTSTDGAGVGAWVWAKRPTGWVVTDGDTGWIGLAHSSLSKPVQIARVGNNLHVSIANASNTASGTISMALPNGFRLSKARTDTAGGPIVDDAGGGVGKATFWDGSLLQLKFSATGGARGFTLVQPGIIDPWPSTLPGTAV